MEEGKLDYDELMRDIETASDIRQVERTAMVSGQFTDFSSGFKGFSLSFGLAVGGIGILIVGLLVFLFLSKKQKAGKVKTLVSGPEEGRDEEMKQEAEDVVRDQ